jgi:aspartate carbamoyltransferase catalytic subunit
MRHREAGAPYLVARNFKSAVINAGDGCHADPTQALLELFTIQEKLGQIDGLKAVVVGDLLHSASARSSIWGLSTLGARITLCAPYTLLGREAFWKATWPHLTISTDLDECMAGADVLIVVRLHTERHAAGILPSLREYSRFFGVTAERVKLAAPHCLVMPVGPIREGIEVMSDVVSSAQSTIEAQITNGVAVCMALLYRLAGDNKR